MFEVIYLFIIVCDKVIGLARAGDAPEQIRQLQRDLIRAHIEIRNARALQRGGIFRSSDIATALAR
jgi:hypothetical protein